MAKLLVIPNDKNLDKYKCDGFILGLQDYSINFPFSFSLEEIRNIKTDKELFISINKNIFEEELAKLEIILQELDKIAIKAIIFYDLAIPNLKEKLSLKKELVWHQEHMTNNYLTANVFNSKGVKYTYLSSDITLFEIEEISKKTKSTLIVPIFGYVPIFTSRRNLVNNYLTFFGLKDNMGINYLEKEDKIYPIIDYKDGCTVYSSNILCGIDEYDEIRKIVDYVVLDSFLITDDIFMFVLDMFNNNINKKVELQQKLPNIDTNFLHKTTIYKVK